jgi:Uma2 family endonuclease
LHHGEVVAVTRPKAKTLSIAKAIRAPLREPIGWIRAGRHGVSLPPGCGDLRVADVAVVSQARYDQIDPDDNLHGAPELVIEIKSLSNTDRHLRELASLGLANGGWGCWIAYCPKTRSI